MDTGYTFGAFITNIDMKHEINNIKKMKRNETNLNPLNVQLFSIFFRSKTGPAAFLTHSIFFGFPGTIRGVHLHASETELDVMKSNYDKMRTYAMKFCGKS